MSRFSRARCRAFHPSMSQARNMTFDIFDQPALLAKYSWLLLTAAVLALSFFIAVIYFKAFARPAYQQAPNSRIALQLEKSFKTSDRFSGFVDDKSSASIVIIELPEESFEQIKTIGNNPAALAAQGVTDVKTAELPGREGDYVYLQGMQKTPLVDYQKYIFIFKENNVCAMITVNVPEAALQSRVITSADIEAILASAAVRETSGTEFTLFELGYTGPFVEDLSLLGNTKGYRLASDAGDKADQTKLRPFFLIAPSLHKLPVVELEQSARKAFHSIDKFKDFTMTSSAPARVGGLQGFEITGEAVDTQNGEHAGLYHLMLAAEGGGYFRLVGIAPKAEMETYLAEFRRISESFRPLM